MRTMNQWSLSHRGMLPARLLAVSESRACSNFLLCSSFAGMAALPPVTAAAAATIVVSDSEEDEPLTVVYSKCVAIVRMQRGPLLAVSCLRAAWLKRDVCHSSQ